MPHLSPQQIWSSSRRQKQQTSPCCATLSPNSWPIPAVSCRRRLRLRPVAPALQHCRNRRAIITSSNPSGWEYLTLNGAAVKHCRRHHLRLGLNDRVAGLHRRRYRKRRFNSSIPSVSATTPSTAVCSRTLNKWPLSKSSSSSPEKLNTARNWCTHKRFVNSS